MTLKKFVSVTSASAFALAITASAASACMWKKEITADADQGMTVVESQPLVAPGSKSDEDVSMSTNSIKILPTDEKEEDKAAE